ncbi:MAG: DUF4402 domain-containing protein [Pseudomonadota bacterium]
MTKIKSNILLAGLAVVLGSFTPAIADDDPNIGGGSADPEFDGIVGAIIINGLNISERQDLDFGVIAPSLTQTDTVHVYRGQNNLSVCGSALTCLEPGNRARYTVTGEPLRYYTISDPGSITISDGNGNTMLVDSFSGAGSANETEWRGWQRLRNSGLARFNVGAILHVNPNQTPGTYTGTYTLTVEYQ